MLARRDLLRVAGVATLGAGLPRLTLAMASPTVDEYDYILTAQSARSEILSGTESDILGFNGQFPAPIIRAKQGERLRIRFINNLDEPTTIHWHGIRLDVAMDGVPHLTQPPIPAGGEFVYDFVCPDAGTFWYHPHMNSVKQLGMGLVGALIVEEREPTPYRDVVIGLKDWRLDADGHYLPLSLPREAARAGTLGTVATVNGKQKPVITVPAGQPLRVRLLNMDNTRVYTIAVPDTDCLCLALDGTPLIPARPFQQEAIGAGMRVDLGIMAPQQVGQDIVIYDMKGRFGIEVCRLRTASEGAAAQPRHNLPSLPPNPIPAPDLANAASLSFVFEWQGALSPTTTTGEVDHSFWLINRRAWDSHGKADLPAPLATLTLGHTYIFHLHNATPHHHPIHLHGYLFTVLSSDKREIVPYQCDTILLEKNERATIAFVADNPGRWMFHCHVIEHMKTGLMGYITVA